MTHPLFTPRLRLVCADAASAHAAADDRTALSRLLEGDIPAAWPPDIMRDAFPFIVNLYDSDPAIGGWGMWFVMLRGKTDLLIGSAGFKGAPGAIGGPGTVEIGYSVIPDYERRGYASETAAALTDWAFGTPEVSRVIAHTFERHHASIGVLRRCGFSFLGPGFEQVDENERLGRGELVLYEITREQWRVMKT